MKTKANRDNTLVETSMTSKSPTIEELESRYQACNGKAQLLDDLLAEKNLLEHKLKSVNSLIDRTKLI